MSVGLRLAGAIVRAGLDSNHLQNAELGSPLTSDQVDNRYRVFDFILDTPVTARYVSVDIPGDDKILSMTEVIVEEVVDEEGLASKGEASTAST